jgi:hypothetical protein
MLCGRVEQLWGCGDAVLVVDWRNTCTKVRYCAALVCSFVTDDFIIIIIIVIII